MSKLTDYLDEFLVGEPELTDGQYNKVKQALEGMDAKYPRWIKAVDEVPKRGGQYHVKAGSDKALWSRKRIIACDLLVFAFI